MKLWQKNCFNTLTGSGKFPANFSEHAFLPLEIVLTAQKHPLTAVGAIPSIWIIVDAERAQITSNFKQIRLVETAR